MKTIRFTRKDYLSGACGHEEYYGQFVTGFIKGLVLDNIGSRDFLRDKFNNDKHFNNIPLEKWDRVVVMNKKTFALDENNDGKLFYSLAGGVCVLKEAARMIVRGEI